MQLQQGLSLAQEQLLAAQLGAEYGAQEAAIDARYLMSYLLHKNFTWLKTWPKFTLSESQYAQWRQLVNRRLKGEPIAYITEQREFWNLTLKCSAASLIPRPETELLVELALQYLQDFKRPKVLDLGTGTGAIGLAIAKELKTSQVTAVDFSADAVALCEQNKQLNQIKNFQVLKSDWFCALGSQHFQLIVANPPYVALGDPHLTQGDLRFEPSSALVSADNGLADIRHIIQQAPQFLLPSGTLMLEHGFQQADEIRQIFQGFGYAKVSSHKDLAANDRVTLGNRV